MARLAGACKIGQNFSNDARELEAVSGKTSRYRHLGMKRMERDDEVLVGRERIHAGRGVHHASVERRNETG